jgi:hypothetical protein
MLDFIVGYYFSNDECIVNDESELELEDTHKYGYILVDSNNNVVKVINRTNPNAKWDWYEIGGRWAGKLNIKSEFKHLYKNDTPNFSWGWDSNDKMNVIRECRVDSALKGHIDFDTPMNKAKKIAETKYDIVYTHILSKFDMSTFKSWKSLLDDDSINVETKRDIYHTQPHCIAFKQLIEPHSDLFSMWEDSLDNYGMGRESYINEMANSSISTYAVVKDGVWYGKGDMGWWGMSDDKFEQNEWNSKFFEMISELDDNTLLTIVDCHI